MNKPMRDYLMNDVAFKQWVSETAIEATTESRWVKVGKASLSYSLWLLANHPAQLSEYLRQILEKII